MDIYQKQYRHRDHNYNAKSKSVMKQIYRGPLVTVSNGLRCSCQTYIFINKLQDCGSLILISCSNAAQTFSQKTTTADAERRTTVHMSEVLITL